MFCLFVGYEEIQAQDLAVDAARGRHARRQKSYMPVAAICVTIIADLVGTLDDPELPANWSAPTLLMLPDAATPAGDCVSEIVSTREGDNMWPGPWRKPLGRVPSPPSLLRFSCTICNEDCECPILRIQIKFKILWINLVSKNYPCSVASPPPPPAHSPGAALQLALRPHWPTPPDLLCG